QKPTILLADLPRFLESAGALAVETAEVALDVLDVGFEIAPDEVGIVTGRLRIAGEEGTGRREAGRRHTSSREAGQDDHSLQADWACQPWVSQTCYLLERGGGPWLLFACQATT